MEFAVELIVGVRRTCLSFQKIRNRELEGIKPWQIKM